MSKFIETYLDKNQKLKILDVGSLNVNGSYRGLFNNPGWEYTGMDIVDGKNVDVVVEPYRWPFIDKCFDVVISGQTFEHVEFPWLTIKEIERVMKPGAMGCLIAPSAGYEHRYPLDCWRIFPDGFRALAKWAKLNVIDSYIDQKGIWKLTILIFNKTK